jgi:hypothetical protein
MNFLQEKFKEFKERTEFNDSKLNILKLENKCIHIHYTDCKYTNKDYELNLDNYEFSIGKKIKYGNLLKKLLKKSFKTSISFKNLNYVVLMSNDIPISFLSFIIENNTITLWNVCSDPIFKNSCQYTLYIFLIYCTRFLKIDKVEKIELWVKKENHIAIHCYQNIGFEIIENETKDDNGHNVYKMLLKNTNSL